MVYRSWSETSIFGLQRLWAYLALLQQNAGKTPVSGLTLFGNKPTLAVFFRLYPRDITLSRVAGWGARIRTWEWRNQNPLPYRLATPQQAAGT